MLGAKVTVALQPFDLFACGGQGGTPPPTKTNKEKKYGKIGTSKIRKFF